MKEYNHLDVEKKWQAEWAKKKAYKTQNTSKKKKYYILDMFPYPSGVGLHVGHPKGYIGSDVLARMKRMQGLNVLHPMGYDAFGLPAEQYALEHGIHPRKAVLENVKTFEKQLSIIGLSYDWERKVNTTDPEFYRWTQWIFLKIYNSWYDKKRNKAVPIEELVKMFQKSGTTGVDAVKTSTETFSSLEWKSKTPKEQQDVLMKYRLAYEGYSEVNWCPVLGTVLANDEVLDSPKGPVSERGGYPVVKKEMRQWFLRITAYADRLISGLEGLEWSQHIKEIQKNWIGKSFGAEIEFEVVFESGAKPGLIPVFTTRPDTLFGATYIVLSPEHLWVTLATDDEHHVLKNKEEVKRYIAEAKNKSEEDRTGSKEKTGVEVKGVKALHPITKKEIPVFVADYVLAHYGTGAIMAVPAHDERDYEFAQKYKLPIEEVVVPNIVDPRNPPVSGKKIVERKNVHAIVRNPKNGKYLALKWKKFNWTTFPMGGVEEDEDVVSAAMREVKEETGFINLKLVKVLPGQVRAEYFAAHKDQNRVSYTTAIVFDLIDEEQVGVSSEEASSHDVIWLDESKLNYENMTHAEVANWKEKMNPEYTVFAGDGVLINSGAFSGLTTEEAKIKITKEVLGKSVSKYKMRDATFARQRYWGEPIPLVHKKNGLIEALPDKQLPLKLPEVKSYEPTGTGESPLAGVSSWVKKGFETNTMPGWAGSSWYYLRYMDPKNKKTFADGKALKYWKNVDMYVGGQEHATGHLLYARFWHKVLKDYGLVPTEEPFQNLKNQGMILGPDNRKMSKRWGNTINPNDIVRNYGADTLRVYEMFMGPFEATLAWNPESIMGSRRFLDRVWKLQDKVGKPKENKKLERTLHKTIDKVTKDIESFAFNTAVSSMMILLNEMEKEEVVSRKDLELFLKILSPFAPHMTEDMWRTLRNKTLLVLEKWPKADLKKIQDTEVKMVFQINGKVRGMQTVPFGIEESEAMELALGLPDVQKWLLNKEIVKKIFIPNKLVNIVTN